jgi:hypothetical protein
VSSIWNSRLHSDPGTPLGTSDGFLGVMPAMDLQPRAALATFNGQPNLLPANKFVLFERIFQPISPSERETSCPTVFRKHYLGQSRRLDFLEETMPLLRVNHFLLAAMAIACCLVCCPSARGEEDSIFEKPIRLQADGKDIDTGDALGHSGPCFADVDDDGLRDLVVGDFSGKFRIYRNVGSQGAPKFAGPSFLMAGPVEARVPIYCCVGSSPHFADFDGDGKHDLLSGSYDPGECYLFRGLGHGKYAERQTIVDTSGNPVVRSVEHQSVGSWPVMVDWDNDGDLDLLVGTFIGTIFVRLNEGSAQRPEFGETNLNVEANGELLRVPSGMSGHAATAVCDWDNDGVWDIVSGCETGAVYWYRNVGTLGVPKFAAAETLVPEHDGNGHDEILESDADAVPGIRSQIFATDYNGDGKIDLLLGDFCTTLTPKPGLTTTEHTKMLSLYEGVREAQAHLRDANETLRVAFCKQFPGDECFSVAATVAWRDQAIKLVQDPKYKAWQTKAKTNVPEMLATYLAKPSRRDRFNDYCTCHGYVWLFQRK